MGINFPNLQTPVCFNATTFGIGNFVVASAVTGYVVPESANVTDGKAYNYYARSLDGSIFEFGNGVYTIASHTLARTTIFANSNGDTSPVDFALAPIVYVFPSPTAKLEATSGCPQITLLTTGIAQTFNRPTYCTWMRVRMVGGGAGGAGGSSNNTAGNGSNGGNTTFGSLLAGGGGGGIASTQQPGPGGPASGGNIMNCAGCAGTAGGIPGQGADGIGGAGGCSPFGGNGFGEQGNGVGAVGYGSGGAGGYVDNASLTGAGGPGGGSGGYVEHVYSAPASSYSYTIGHGGAAGVFGTNGGYGGAGMPGAIIIESYFN